ncbi:MAG: SpoVG family protein [Planctomycetota bacterium]|jgi:stage V sporulation protein G
MQVTEVKVRIVRDGGKEKLRAFASITLDNSFVVREVKVIEGDKGLFVAMPSRKVTEKCRKCNHRNVVQSKFCNICGDRLPPESASDNFQREKLYMDVAHPINSQCRNMIHQAVIDEYNDVRNQLDTDSLNAPRNETIQNTSIEKKEEISVTEDAEPSVKETPAAANDDSFNQGIFS